MDAGKVAGIDWASEVHVACVMDADGTVAGRLCPQPATDCGRCISDHPEPECPTGGSGFTVRRRAHPIHARLGCPDMRLRRPKSPHLGDPR